MPGTETDHGTLGTWQPHGRMVRSPEFTLTSKNLWYLVRGSLRVYASVNSHLMIAGPLHGSLLREFKQTDAEWHWVSHGLEQYRDHRMHIEFSSSRRFAVRRCDGLARRWRTTDPRTDLELDQSRSSRSAATAERAATYGKRFSDAAKLLDETNLEGPFDQTNAIASDSSV